MIESTKQFSRAMAYVDFEFLKTIVGVVLILLGGFTFQK
jgi:hypothetical protein